MVRGGLDDLEVAVYSRQRLFQGNGRSGPLFLFNSTAHLADDLRTDHAVTGGYALTMSDLDGKAIVQWQSCFS